MNGDENVGGGGLGGGDIGGGGVGGGGEAVALLAAARAAAQSADEWEECLAAAWRLRRRRRAWRLLGGEFGG